jgi:transposase
LALHATGIQQEVQLLLVLDTLGNRQGLALAFGPESDHAAGLGAALEQQARRRDGGLAALCGAGISTLVADVIIAETGGDMARFQTAGHLASCAGTCPGSNESAGRVKSTHTRPGNPYLKGALGAAAMAAAQSRDTYFAAKYRRIASRRGPVKAIVALEHSHATRLTRWSSCTTPLDLSLAPAGLGQAPVQVPCDT